MNKVPFEDHDYYQALDKRTKEYKEYKDWLKNKPSEGLGDTIEKITEKTGIKKAVDYIFDKLGKDCGCEERKKKLNQMFRYNTPECLTKDEYEWLDQFYAKKRTQLEPQDQHQLLVIHNRIFNAALGMSNCSPCVRTLIDTMHRVYKEYQP